MTKLSKSYVQQHRIATHTYAAFGKLLVDAILDKTEVVLGDTEQDQVGIFERSRPDSNRCRSFCRALPSHSATRP
jgi:hypothetical protein